MACPGGEGPPSAEHPVLLLLFMWMETKAQRGEGTCSKPHSTELEPDPDLLTLSPCPLTVPHHSAKGFPPLPCGELARKTRWSPPQPGALHTQLVTLLKCLEIRAVLASSFYRCKTHTQGGKAICPRSHRKQSDSEIVVSGLP